MRARESDEGITSVCYSRQQRRISSFSNTTRKRRREKKKNPPDIFLPIYLHKNQNYYLFAPSKYRPIKRVRTGESFPERENVG